MTEPPRYDLSALRRDYASGRYWRCTWCKAPAAETMGRCDGPSGPGTLSAPSAPGPITGFRVLQFCMITTTINIDSIQYTF